MEYTWEEPLCLIENTADHGLIINESTLRKLSQVKVPVSVVSIVGIYRTGKSYLMNLVAGGQTGFALGSKIQSKTKGIWAWCRPHPVNRGQCLLLLDTEGLGDVEKGDKNHDTWIFALAVLLSSTFVYNSVGTINQDALSNLHFVTEISEHIKVKATSNEEDDTEFDAFFPHFIWAVRDFTLELEVDGKSITADQYLEHALTPKPGHSKKVKDFNLPRDCIRNYFRERKCFAFPQPVHDHKQLKDLEILNRSDLDPEFLQISDDFVKYVTRRIQAKTIASRPITGSVLGNLAKCYVEAIQKGAVPCIESAVETTAKVENTKAVEKSIELYRSKMLEKVNLPTESLQELSIVHQMCEQATVTHFLNAAIFDTDLVYQKQMMEKVIKEYEGFCKQNEEASIAKCSEILSSIYDLIENKIHNGEYTKPGGYELYKKDMDNLEIKYIKTPGKGIMANDVLNKFMKSKDVEGQNILAADKKLNEEQRKAEDEKRKAEEYKRQQEVAEEEKQKLQQYMIDQEKSHEENMKQLKEKLQKDRADLMKEQDALLERKMREQEDMLTKGFKQQADDLKREVDRLKTQREMEKVNSGGGLFGMIGTVLDKLLLLK